MGRRAAPAGKSTWPDARLINAIRREPPDRESLNTLVDRYWKPLYARCFMLTLDAEDARGLAQESLLRIVISRHSIQPDRPFQVHVITIATDLWRNINCGALRAELLADSDAASVGSAANLGKDESITLAETLADARALSFDDELRLEMDLDQALVRLEPRLRDVLIACLIDGDSAAEIGQRYHCSEQSVTGWIREAIGQISAFLAGEHASSGRFSCSARETYELPEPSR